MGGRSVSAETEERGDCRDGGTGDRVPDLRVRLRAVQAYLGRGTALSLGTEERERLLRECGRLLDELDRCDESILTVGLLGGTGVGKSTLMNALAGEEISSVSHRRPHTDQVILYHHRSVPVPPIEGKEEIRFRAVPHEAGSMEQVLLCDLPDFDSLVGDHRKSVLRFLEHLDVLIWVVSPEKYADAKFYDLLAEVPKARQNFYFVLNKIDLFFEESPAPGREAGYEAMNRVAAGFLEKLRQVGFDDPMLAVVSAREPREGRVPLSANQLSSLRRQIYRERDRKEIQVIKASNVAEGVRRLSSPLDREALSLKSCLRVLEEIAGFLDQERSAWRELGERLFSRWLNEDLRSWMEVTFTRPDALVGAGRGWCGIVLEWKRAVGRLGGTAASIPELEDPEPLHLLEQRWNHLDDHIQHRLLRAGISPQWLADTATDVVNPARWADIRLRLQEHLRNRTEGPRDPGLRMFKILQYAGYLALFLAFLFSLAAEVLQRQPGTPFQPPSWTDLLWALLLQLFGPGGLCALLSFLLLQGALGWWFYMRYKKYLRRRVQKFIESLSRELAGIWVDELDARRDLLKECSRRVEERLAEITFTVQENP